MEFVMTIELLVAFVTFAFVSSITPGPNNLMLMASGANFGFGRSLPHMFGVGLGFTFMILMVGLGLMKVFELYPVSYQVLKVLSVMYLLYLAFKIATSKGASGEPEQDSQPLTFVQAAAFQWVNPKAWTMALTSISAYSPDDNFRWVVLIASVFAAISVISCSTWVVVGKKINAYLKNATQQLVFNYVMAALLVATLYPVLMP
jgi:threonine/homoserine/homoserine lactone efflux protein